ncbi:MAG: CehA/McbA family metallohydrolase [Bryobacteraceae bacterium]
MRLKNFSRATLVRASLGSWFVLAPIHLFGQSDVGALNVAIRDKVSGQVVPAMICITALADGSWRMPPDGRQPAPYVSNKSFIAGRLKEVEYVAGDKKKWYPGDVGPAVLTTGDFREDPKHWYENVRPMPYWKEPAAYFVSKPFTIELPPGKYRLAVQRGPEYLPYIEEFAVAAGQKLSRSVKIGRWVDMPRRGWYSGDAHVHSWRTAPLHDEFIITWAQAMDVHMTVAVSYGNQRANDGSIQKNYGEASRFHRGDYWVESGAEDPRVSIEGQGHVTQINIQNAVRDARNYHLYDRVFDGVHRQGGLVGYSHLAWSPAFFRRKDPNSHAGWDASINIIRGKVDFIDILEAAHMGLEDFYDFLNLGVKLIAMGSSDYPAASVGEERTYAYTGPGKFTVDSWYAAVKQGHTFTTNGPMLVLSVGGKMPGDEVRVAKNTVVRVRAEVWAPEAIGAPKVLEVVAHGRVIRSAEASGPKQGKLVVEFDLPAAKSQWIAARTTSFNGALAHTSPVYLIVDGASFLDRSQVKQIVAQRLKVLDFIEDRLREPKGMGYFSPGELDELRKSVQDARTKYQASATSSDR